MKITICAGHSNAEPGNTWGGLREADLMDEFAHLVALKLRALGHEVIEDGGRGENWPLPQAMKLIAGAALAIEFHTNASSNRSATGVEIVCKSEHMKLAQALSRVIGDVLEIPLRREGGWYSAGQHAIDRDFSAGFVRHGGLIVELFFQSNQAELDRYLARKEAVAEAVANVVHDHLGKRA